MVGAKAALAAVLALALAACGGMAGPAETAGSGAGVDPAPRGQASRLPRVVSLNPCIDAILVEIAQPEQIVALSHYSALPDASSIPLRLAARHEVTGGTVEEILALDPDLVLAGAFLAPATRHALADLEIGLATFDIPRTPAQSYAQIGRIAQLVGQQQRGAALVARIERSLAQYAAPTATELLSAVLWQPGQIVPGEATLASDLLRRAGFSSHSAARGLGQSDYLPLERLLADPPDVLLVAGDAAGQRHPALRKLEGVHVAQFDPRLLYCAGPTMERAARRLAHIRASVE